MGLCELDRFLGQGLEQVWAVGWDSTGPSSWHFDQGLWFPLGARKNRRGL